MEDWDSLQAEYDASLLRARSVRSSNRHADSEKGFAVAVNPTNDLKLKLTNFRRGGSLNIHNQNQNNKNIVLQKEEAAPPTSTPTPASPLIAPPLPPSTLSTTTVSVPAPYSHEMSHLSSQSSIQANPPPTQTSQAELQSKAVRSLMDTLNQLEWNSLEVPSVESIHQLAVTTAELKWECCLYTGHLIAQEESLLGETSKSYNKNVHVPSINSPENNDWWQQRAVTIQLFRASPQLVARSLISHTIVSETLVSALMYQVMDTDEQRTLLLAETAKISKKQHPQHWPPPPMLAQMLTAIAQSRESQQYLRSLFDENLRQMYRNIDRSSDKQPSSSAAAKRGGFVAVEQTQHRCIRAILNFTHVPLPPLVQAAICILSDMGYDASNFFFGTLICDSLRETLFLPFIKVVGCAEKLYSNDTNNGCANMKAHLHQVSLVLERVFGVTDTYLDKNISSGVTDTYLDKNISSNSEKFDKLEALAEKYSHKFGPQLTEYWVTVSEEAAASFREFAHDSRWHRTHSVESVSRCVCIKECDLIELCSSTVTSSSLDARSLQTMLSVLNESRNLTNRRVLCIPLMSRYLTMKWSEMVYLQDFGLEVEWGDAARLLSRVQTMHAMSSELIATSHHTFFSEAQLVQIVSLNQEMCESTVTYERLRRIIDHLDQEVRKQRVRSTLLCSQSSGMMLRECSTNNLDDGLIPLYRPLLNKGDSILEPLELESTIFLENAGSRHHKKEGDPLNARRQKYIRGGAINDRLRIQDRPHQWRSPVARTRMQLYADAQEKSIKQNCTFQPNLNVQRRAVADLLKFEERIDSVPVDHAERPAWNSSLTLEGKDLSLRWTNAERHHMKRRTAKKEQVPTVPEVFLSFNF